MKQEFKDKIREIENKYNLSGINQITIDLIEDTAYLITRENDGVIGDRSPVTGTDIQAASYDVTIVLDVINPELTKDIEALNELVEFFEEVYLYVKDLNK